MQTCVSFLLDKGSRLIVLKFCWNCELLKHYSDRLSKLQMFYSFMSILFHLYTYLRERQSLRFPKSLYCMTFMIPSNFLHGLHSFCWLSLLPPPELFAVSLNFVMMNRLRIHLLFFTTGIRYCWLTGNLDHKKVMWCFLIFLTSTCYSTTPPQIDHLSSYHLISDVAS